MGKQELSAAFEAMMNDSGTADRIAAGDFTDLGESELTDAERAMVQAAAADVPDVDGFMKQPNDNKVGFLKLGDIDRSSPFLKLGVAAGFYKIDG